MGVNRRIANASKSLNLLGGAMVNPFTTLCIILLIGLISWSNAQGSLANSQTVAIAIPLIALAAGTVILFND